MTLSVHALGPTMVLLHLQLAAAGGPEVPPCAGTPAYPRQDRPEEGCDRHHADPPPGNAQPAGDPARTLHRHRRLAERASGDPRNPAPEIDRDHPAHSGWAGAR